MTGIETGLTGGFGLLIVVVAGYMLYRTWMVFQS